MNHVILPVQSKTATGGINAIQNLPKLAGIPLALFAGQMFATQAIAASTEWNVSLWGKPRAFTAHVEKLAELVYEKTKGDFELNLHFGGLSKNKENLDGISIGAFEMAQFCAGYHSVGASVSWCLIA
jgi:TRAP-type C4-dicarboxylate transport system substrate-binding protein